MTTASSAARDILTGAGKSMSDKNSQNLALADEFEILERFSSRYGLALSVYLDLRSTKRRDRAMDPCAVVGPFTRAGDEEG